MRATGFALVAALCAAQHVAPVFAQTITPQDAVNAAKSTPLPDPRTFATPANAAQVPGASGDTTQQRGQFGGGKGNPTPAGVDRVNQCLAANDPECLAVQLVATGKAGRPQFSIDQNDPLVQFGDQVRAQPGTPPENGTQTCTTNVVQYPGTTVTEYCAVVQVGAENTCSVIRRVEVDADANYRCQAEGARTVTTTCPKTLQVDVQLGNPTCVGSDQIVFPRTTTTFYSSLYNKIFHVEAGYVCELDRTDGFATLVFGAGTDGEIAGEFGLRAVVRIDAAAPPAGQLPQRIGTATTKYAIPIGVYYATSGNSVSADQWNVTLFFDAATGYEDVVGPPFLPAGPTCPAGMFHGQQVLLGTWITADASGYWSFDRPGDPWLCYGPDATGAGSQVLVPSTGQQFAAVTAPLSGASGFSPRGSDMLQLNMSFPRPTIPIVITDSWIDGCSALGGRL